MAHSSQSKSRGPYAKTAERRKSVAQAALAIISETGHQALTMTEVAERVGISERALLYHFPSRDHVLVAAAEYHDTRERPIPYSEDEYPVENSIDLLTEHVTRADMRNRNVMRLTSLMQALALDPEHPAHDYVQQRTSTALTWFGYMVSQRQQAGLAHPDIDPAATARQMLAIWDGLQTQWLMDPAFDLADRVNQAFRRLTGQSTMEARGLLDQFLEQI